MQVTITAILVVGYLVAKLVFGLRPNLLLNYHPDRVIVGFVVGGGILASVGGILGGVIMGIYGLSWLDLFVQRSQDPSELGHFLSSRPISNTEFSNAVLRLIWKNVFVSWAIWAAGFLLASIVLLALGQMPFRYFPASVRWWYFPVTLFGCWTGAATISSLLLAGNQKLCKLFVAVVEGGGFLFYFSCVWLLSGETQLLVFAAAKSILGIGLVIGSAWLFLVAQKDQLINRSTTIVCTCVWILITSIMIVEKIRHPTDGLSSYVLSIGAAALTVVPFAAAPLAIAMNRTR